MKNVCSSATTGILIFCQVASINYTLVNWKENKQSRSEGIIPYVPGERVNGSGDHS